MGRTKRSGIGRIWVDRAWIRLKGRVRRVGPPDRVERAIWARRRRRSSNSNRISLLLRRNISWRLVLGSSRRCRGGLNRLKRLERRTGCLTEGDTGVSGVRLWIWLEKRTQIDLPVIVGFTISNGLLIGTK